MLSKKTVFKISAAALTALLYAFVAASSVPEEEVLTKGWLCSYESAYPESSASEKLFPFETAAHFGYFDAEGKFTLSRLKKNKLSISEKVFAEYDAVPQEIEIRDNRDQPLSTLPTPQGYPLFLNDRVYLVSFEQNAVSALSPDNELQWNYVFTAPLTCVAGAGGYLLTGALNGAIELLDENGKRVFFFETGGSRITCVYGVAVSDDLSHLAVVSGVDNQRILIFEQYAGSYRVVFHEFTGLGKRRPVRVLFGGGRVFYEHDKGLGIYEIKTRTNRIVPLEGEISAIDGGGTGGSNIDNDRVYLVVEKGGVQRLLAVDYPATVTMNAPFKSAEVFLHRRGKQLFVGTERTLVSFMLEKK
jgi:hypothetical protein